MTVGRGLGAGDTIHDCQLTPLNVDGESTPASPIHQPRSCGGRSSKARSSVRPSLALHRFGCGPGSARRFLVHLTA